MYQYTIAVSEGPIYMFTLNNDKFSEIIWKYFKRRVHSNNSYSVHERFPFKTIITIFYNLIFWCKKSDYWENIWRD